jgi:DNA topoisomerase-1
MSNLVIVESPAKAKTIKKYLGKGYQVEASMGHLRDLPKSQFGVDIEHDFEPKYISIRGKGELISKLKKEARHSEKVYLATDPDREGEAISWHLAKLLDLDETEPIRVTFNEITKPAVKQGIKNPRTISQNLVYAQQTRRILDRIVGYKLSPILWKRVKKGLSAGRVQSVATRLIIDRENEINAFVPQEYWTIDAKYTNGKKQFGAKFYGDKKGKIELSNQQDTERVLENINNKEHVVANVKRGEKQKSPPPPFITSTLQQETSRKLNFQARRTMSVAQELYEGVDIKGYGTQGLITYMRTDSLRVSEEAIGHVRNFISEKYPESLPPSPRFYKSKRSAQDAHEAIRPTNMELEPERIKASLSNDQYKLYKLIWDRFVASQMTNAVYTTITADIAAGDYLFRTSGQTVKKPGFITLYEESKDEKGTDVEKNLPDLAQGDVLKLKKIEHQQKFTQPPARYTEASLIKVLEENGIGRPSTYAPTITTILSRGYVVREGKSLKPTPLGEVTTQLLSENFKNIVDVDFTAKMENDLDKIEENGKDWVSTLRDFYAQFAEELKTAEEKLGDLHIKIPDEVSDVPCEKCGRMMVYKMGRFGKFLACPGFPECRNTKAITQEIGVACPLCGGKILIKKSKKGRKYFGCENNPTCTFMSWDEPLAEKCPQCQSMLLKKTKWKKEIYCSNSECSYERSGKA